MKWIWLFLTPCVFAAELQLQGLPRQLDWVDVDQDGRQDLVALMLVSQTEGSVETFFVDGRLHGVYEDETIKEKYLVVWRNTTDGWQETERLPLAQQTVLGFHAEPGLLALWTQDELTRYRWVETRWELMDALPTPGLLARESVSMADFPFWLDHPDGDHWLVPDLDGIHQIQLDQPEQRRFLPYAEQGFDHQINSHEHTMTLTMPRQLDVDGDRAPDVLFHDDREAVVWPATGAPLRGEARGELIDLNNDGLADLVDVEPEGEIERRKDLPKVKSRIKIYLARAPLEFPEEPDREQVVPGFVLNEADDEVDITLPDPFIDINRDGLPDLAGLAFKLSVWQIAKVLTTQRLTLRFLLHLSVQEEDGRYRLLSGGPFEMTWKINLRRLEFPTFAQMTADFDGDGWIDVLTENKNRLEITPVDTNGFRNDRTFKVRIPKSVRDPDQVYGRDLDGDGRAEAVLIKIKGGTTTVHTMAVKP